MDKQRVKMFYQAYEEYMATTYGKHSITLQRLGETLQKLDQEKKHIINAIKSGIPADEFKDELDSIAKERTLTEAMIYSSEKQPTPLPAKLSNSYNKKIQSLRSDLSNIFTKAQAVEKIRSLIDKIILLPEPENKEYTLYVYGNITEILALASNGEIKEDDKKRLL